MQIIHCMCSTRVEQQVCVCMHACPHMAIRVCVLKATCKPPAAYELYSRKKAVLRICIHVGLSFSIFNAHIRKAKGSGSPERRPRRGPALVHEEPLRTQARWGVSIDLRIYVFTHMCYIFICYEKPLQSQEEGVKYKEREMEGKGRKRLRKVVCVEELMWPEAR